MEFAKQRVRAAVARKKEEKKVKETEGGTLLAPKTVSKVSKRKPDGKDDCPSKKVAVTSGDVSPKGKSPLQQSHGAGKGVMTSSGPVIKGPCCLLTHKDYAVEEVGSFLKLMNIGSCNLLRTEDLRASALFDLDRVCSLLQARLISFLSNSFD